MKKSDLITMLACAAIFALYFMPCEVVASDAAQGNKTVLTHSESKKMKFSEIMQKLEVANPWTVKKISEALGVELYGLRLHDYGDGLIINHITYRSSEAVTYPSHERENRILSVSLKLDRAASCFTLDSFKKEYPDMEKMETKISALIAYQESYFLRKPWRGGLTFSFKKTEDFMCLTEFGIHQIPPEPEHFGKLFVVKEHKMKFEELMQKIEVASPWTLEKVSKELDLEFQGSSSSQSKDLFVHNAINILYEEDLFFDRIALILDKKTNKMVQLMLGISIYADCFPIDRVKKIYPDIKQTPLPPGIHPKRTETINYYQVKRSGGYLSFGFYKEKRPSCLYDVFVTPEKQ